MVRICGKNGWVPYCQKGVEVSGRKWEGGYEVDRGYAGWMGNRRMMVEAARQCAKDSKERRALVHM